MKKLLSICFLSILLGLLSFGARAQSNACESGFWIENLNPETITGIVNVPGGELVLKNTMNKAAVGNTDLYELHFCNNCGLDSKTKVSIDWLLYRDGQLVNDNLSEYADLFIYTKYDELNINGQCQQIHWLGGKVYDGYGYCNIQQPADMFSGVICNAPNNYPGALQADQGYPFSVFYNDNINPANGFVNIYSQAHDYFYLDFFMNTRNIVKIKWNQVGNYSLVMRVRERVGGTDWTNETWIEGSETDYIGGHQSCCGPIIAQDSIHYLVTNELFKEQCANDNAVDPFKYGKPEYTFTKTMSDTLVVFMETVPGCDYTRVDSIIDLHFFIRENPNLASVTKEVCRCEEFTSADLVALLDTVKSEGMKKATFWWLNGNTWTTTVPTPATEVGTYTYTVKQINTYETIDCEGEPATITFTVNPIPAPEIKADKYDFCNEIDSVAFNTKFTAELDDVNKCSTKINWYVEDGNNKVAIGNGKSFTANLKQFKPADNVDKAIKVVAYAVGEKGCDSTISNVLDVYFHRTPEITLTYDKEICPMPDTVRFALKVENTKTTTNVHQNAYNYSIEIVDFADKKFTDNLTGTNSRVDYKYWSSDGPVYFECNKNYSFYFTVTDKFGCSVKDTATFKAVDTVAPVVTPAAATNYVNACDIQTVDVAAIQNDIRTNAAFENANVTDNCSIDWSKTTVVADTQSTVLDACESQKIVTYTFFDYCGNTATFTQTLIAHDSVAPYFDFSSSLNGAPFVKINPIPAGNCTYDAPDSATFVNAIKPYIKDNCTDVDYLLSTLVFRWENTTLSSPEYVFNEKDIFKAKNHLTVSVAATDKCGNEIESVVIYLDRPDTLSITQQLTSLDPICENNTTTISFDDALIVDDTIVGPFLPYTYQWTEVNGREVVFGDATAKETTIAPVGNGDFVFVMTVTNGNGCVATSAPYYLHVNAIPNIAIYKDVRNGAVEPYCPTYGNMTIYAADAVTGQQISGLKYQWSGESVNEASTIDTTWVTIIPDSCKHDYVATVVATDAIGCSSTASIIIKVDDTEGPIFTGELNDVFAEVVDNCKMYIPDFTYLFNANTVSSDCWQWTDIKNSVKQTPAEGTLMTENTEVTITLTTSCGASADYKVWVKVPEDKLQAKISVLGDSICENDPDYAGITLNAIPVNGVEPFSFVWTRENQEIESATAANQSYEAQDVAENNQNTQINYQVEIIDGVGCVATTEATITVFYKGTLPDTATYPNTLCVGHNGSLVLYGVIKDYSYAFQGQVKIHDVPEHETTPSNTMVFDHCYAGVDMPLTVTTPDGCVQTMLITIANDNDDKPAIPTVTITDPTNCYNNDGKIVVNTLAGNTYYFSKNGSDYQVLASDTIINVTPDDVYNFCCVNNVTGCKSDTLKGQKVILFDGGYLVPAEVTADNTSCVEPNGSIFLSAANANYTVIAPNQEVIYEGVGNHTVENLAVGTYTINATDVNTNCSGTLTLNVSDAAVYPVVKVTPKHDFYCDADTHNGTFELNVTKVNNYTYTVTNNGQEVAATDYSALAAGSYIVTVTSNMGCVATANFKIDNKAVVPEINTISSTLNTLCFEDQHDGTISVALKTKSNQGNTFTYELSQNGEVLATQTVNASNYTFNGLNSGTYNVTVTTQYGCQTNSEITVDQYQLTTLDMRATPNTMCEGTFEKPGNGTIIIDAPHNTQTRHYSYNYYFANDETMDVPYHNPLSYTKYWLADNTYKVVVLEQETGCKVSGTIIVPKETFTVTPEFTVTDNTNCEGSYNGTITVSNVISANENADWTYSMDNQTFTTNNVFTGLKDGAYTVYVKDNSIGCVYDGTATIENGDQCAPVITVFDTKNDTADVFHYCVGEVVNLMASAKAADGCDEGEYDYSWFVDCHSRTSDNNTIDVLTDEAPFCCHYVVTAKSLATGCSQSKNVLVCVESTPQVRFMINDELVNGNTAAVCVNNDTKIEVVKSYTENGYTTNLASCEWTNAIHTTSFDTTFLANTLVADSSYSFCVDVTSEYGCPNRGIFTLRVNDIAKSTQDVYACTNYTFTRDNIVKDFAIQEITVPEVVTFYDTLSGKATSGCDSIVTYNIHFLGKPGITSDDLSNNIPVLCEGKTYADVLAAYNVVIANAADTTITFDGNTVALTDELEFTTDDPRSLTITCSNQLNGCDSILPLGFYITGKPDVPTIEFGKTAYCAGTTARIMGSESNYNTYLTASRSLSLVLIDSTNVDAVVETVIKENFTAPENLTMYTQYGKDKVYFALKASNDCFTTYSNLVHITVDSSVVNLTPVTVCEGNKIDFDEVLGQYKDLKGNDAVAYLIKGTAQGEPITEDYEFGYDATETYKITFTGLDGGACEAAICDTVTVTVNPKPVISANDLPAQPICREEAADIFESLITNVKNADREGWLIRGISRENIAVAYNANADLSAAEYETVASDDYTTLVDKAFGYFTYELTYYAVNGCDSVVNVFAKSRLTDGPVVSAEDSVEVCNNTTLAEVLEKANASIDWNNWRINNNDTMYNSYTNYAIVRNGSVVKNYTGTQFKAQLNTTLASIPVMDGDSLKIVATTSNEDCGGFDTAYIKLNLQTITFVEDTLQNACAGSQFSEFIKAAPQFTGKATRVSEKWYIAPSAEMINAQVIEESDVISYAQNGYFVSYTWITDCGDSVYTTPKTLTVDTTATINFTTNNVEVCEGSTISLENASVSIFTVNSTTTISDTTFAVNEVANIINDIKTYEFAKDDSLLIITVTNVCGDATDTLKVTVNPLPTPEVDGNVIVCNNTEVELKVNNAVDGSTYVWYNKTDDSEVATASGTTPATINSTEGINEYYVEEIDAKGCKATSEGTFTVESSDNPQFIFTYDGAETHNITGIQTSTDQFLNYTWKIDQMCLDPDTLVYVNFYIYHNDTLIDNSKIGDYFVTQSQAIPQSQGGGTMNWIGSDFITWINADGSNNSGFTTYYNESMPLSTPNAYSGNHYPHSTLGTLNNNSYSSFYLHFFNKREVTKTVAPIKIPGEYKIRYELWSTSHNENFQDKYTNNTLLDHDTTMFIGAQNAKASGTTGNQTILKILAVDSLIITVEGDPIIVDAAPAAAPQSAPVIANISTEKITPSMNVWPNPATTATTKLSARIYNMNGDAAVTISEMSGRQIFGDKTFIDSDDYYYECSVNNLSQGVYVMTVRTKEGLVTKKLVVRK